MTFLNQEDKSKLFHDLLNQVIEDHSQYMCGCKHPACKNCERDSVRDALINQVIGAE